jgi:hypothetical protein
VVRARRARWIHLTPDKGASLAAFEAAGVERIMLQDFAPRLEMIEPGRVAVRLRPRAAASQPFGRSAAGGPAVARSPRRMRSGLVPGRGDRERHRLERAGTTEEHAQAGATRASGTRWPPGGGRRDERRGVRPQDCGG